MFRLPEGWASSGVDPDKLSRHAVRNDRWDARKWGQVRAELAELETAVEEMVAVTPTGEPLMGDLFYSFVKAAPELEDADAVRPDHLDNLAVVEQALDLGEHAALRHYTRGDVVASASAVLAIADDVQTLADRQRKQREKLDALQEQLRKLRDSLAEQRSLDEMMDAWTGDHPDGDACPDCGGGHLTPAEIEQRRKDLADAICEMQQAADALQQAVEDGQAQLIPSLRTAIAAALSKAMQAARDMALTAEAWGYEKGQLERMPADEKFKLARRLNRTDLREIAKRFGRIRNLALTMRDRKTKLMPDEIVNITLGNEISRLLPSELMKLDDPDLELDFLRGYAEGRLQQYELEGVERVGRGGIYLCQDSSGSMAGEPEWWAYGLMLALLDIARREKRAFHHVLFGGRGQIIEHRFETDADYTPENLLRAAEEKFTGAGTDFETPLNRCVEMLQSEHREKGLVEGDILFLTDGICGVSDRWTEWFVEERERLQFTTWGVLIGQPRTRDPLYTLCERKTATIRDFFGGRDMATIFRDM